MCVGIQPLLPLCYTVRMCIHRLLNALAVAPVPPRSLRSVEARRTPGSRARFLRGASWRNHPPEYRCLIAQRAGFSSALSRSNFGLFSEKQKNRKNLEVDFWIEGEKISCPTVYNCLPLSAARQQRQHKSIYFSHTLKNPNSSYAKAVY